MSFLERAIRNGIRKGIGDAVGNAVQKAVEPKATELANKAAQSLDQAAQNTQQTVRPASGLEGALSNLERSMQGYATEVAKNKKICPQCGQIAGADQKFCPSCGTKLPEQTVAQEAVCPACGKQNSIGTRFCAECGTKLPAAVAEEQAQAQRNAAVMAEWDVKLPQYPKWTCGGTKMYIDDYDTHYIFGTDFGGNAAAAQRAVAEYRQVLLANGFRQAGEYPCIEHLYKRVDGVVYHADTEHCFDGDSDCPSIGFDKSEPRGGFDYVKPEPKKQVKLKDFFKF